MQAITVLPGVADSALLDDIPEPPLIDGSVLARTVALGVIGLLAALLGLERGLEVHVLDYIATGPKPALARALGATHHAGEMSTLDGFKPDILVECTGAPSVIRDCLAATAAGGIVCLAGVTHRGAMFDLDIGLVNRTMVLENDTVFGTVNANRRHYRMAAESLARADKKWLAGPITRRVPIDRWSEALDPRPNDIKSAIEFAP